MHKGNVIEWIHSFNLLGIFKIIYLTLYLLYKTRCQETIITTLAEYYMVQRNPPKYQVLWDTIMGNIADSVGYSEIRFGVWLSHIYL